MKENYWPSLISQSLSEDEKGLAEETVRTLGAKGILWLAANDSLVSAWLPVLPTLETLEEDAVLLVDTLTHKHGLTGGPEFPDVDIDESVSFGQLDSVGNREVIPVTIGGECIGGLLVYLPDERPDEELLGAIAMSFAIRFRARRQQRRLDGMTDRLNEIAEVGRAFVEVGEAELTCSRILEVALRTSLSEAGALLQIGPDGGVVAYGMPEEILRTIRFNDRDDIVERALKLEKPLVIPSSEAAGVFDGSEVRIVLDSAGIFPLYYESERYGAMILLNGSSELMRDPTFVAVLETISNLAASALATERRQNERIEQESVKQELRAAHTIQQSLLPKKLPALGSLEIDGVSIPSRSVGGDFYDVFSLDGGRIGVIIADVSGKGIAAGLLMATARSYLRVVAERFPNDPGKALETLNGLLAGEIADNKFITATYVIFDADRRTMKLAGAGHHAPAIVGPKGMIDSKLNAGLPLGIFEDAEYEVAHLEVEKGTMVALYTDGIIEAKNAEGELFGTDRCVRHLAAANEKPLREIIDSMWEETVNFASDGVPDDDWTLVLARFR